MQFIKLDYQSTLLCLLGYVGGKIKTYTFVDHMPHARGQGYLQAVQNENDDLQEVYDELVIGSDLESSWQQIIQGEVMSLIVTDLAQKHVSNSIYIPENLFVSAYSDEDQNFLVIMWGECSLYIRPIPD